MQKFSLTSNTVLLIYFTSLSPVAFAAGFYNDLQSTSLMGNAFAGAGAAGDDASVMFYNPASLMLFDEGQVVFSGIYAAIDSEFTVDSAHDSAGDLEPAATGQQYSALPDQFSPAIYAAAPLGDDFVLGMSLTSPYEVESDYSDTLVDNTARQTQFISYTGNLSLAMEVTEQLSLGVGANLQYFKAKVNANLHGSEVISGDPGPTTIIALSEYQGDDIAFYPNFGLLYEFTEDTRIGLNYRMHVDHDTEGDFFVDFEVIQPDGSIQLGSLNSPGNSLIKLPDMASINLFHEPFERVELLFDVMFTRWSRFQDLTVTVDEVFENESQPVNTTLNFKDAWRVGVGANYYLSDEIKLRSGFSFDESPVTDETRTLQGPDSNQISVAVGMMYKPKAWERTHLDFAYMHTFFQDGTVSQINPLVGIPFPAPIIIPDTLTATGTFNTSADFLGVQLVRVM